MNSCAELESYLKDSKKEQLKIYAVSIHDRTSYFEGDDILGDNIVSIQGELPHPNEASTMSQDSSSESDSLVSSHGSINQEQNINEGDLIQHWGPYLFQIVKEHLVISKLWPVAEAATISHLKVNGLAYKMILTDNNKIALVLYPKKKYPEQSELTLTDDGLAPPIYFRTYEEDSVVILVNLDNLAMPFIEESFFVKGNISDVRSLGDQIILKSSYYPGDSNNWGKLYELHRKSLRENDDRNAASAAYWRDVDQLLASIDHRTLQDLLQSANNPPAQIIATFWTQGSIFVKNKKLCNMEVYSLSIYQKMSLF